MTARRKSYYVGCIGDHHIGVNPDTYLEWPVSFCVALFPRHAHVLMNKPCGKILYASELYAMRGRKLCFSKVKK